MILAIIVIRIIFAKSNDNHRWYKSPGEAEPGNPETWNHLRRKTGLAASSQLLRLSPSSPFSIIIRTTRKQEQDWQLIYNQQLLMTFIHPAWQKLAAFRRMQKCNIYYVRVHFLHKEDCFAPEKNNYLPKVSQKVRKSRQIPISRQNSDMIGPKISPRVLAFRRTPFAASRNFCHPVSISC